MLDLKMNTQPDDESCGPTSLHAVYSYFGYSISLEDCVKTVQRSHSGGTLAPMLGNHALSHGFNATIYVNNLNIFDPSWFIEGHVDPMVLKMKLKQQLHYKKNKNLIQVSRAYKEYLNLGGQVRFVSLGLPLFKSYFDRGVPIITGLSATYLYRSPRESFTSEGKSYYDDVKGKPCGHFVVLCGYDEPHRHVVVADPHRENPISHDNYYKVNGHHLINSIMLGVITYDANLLILEPK